MELVVNDLCLRRRGAGGRGEVGPHVHRCRRDLFALGLRQAFPQSQGLVGIPSR